jgi:nitrate reductase alpha subunit
VDRGKGAQEGLPGNLRDPGTSTGTQLAETREDEKIPFRDLLAQPRKIISSPTWSGIESEHVSYTASYTNVHELIPWRTLTGRQQFYQDHRWFRDFGEGFAVYRPPIDTRTTAELLGKRSNGQPEIILNFITPHQKFVLRSWRVRQSIGHVHDLLLCMIHEAHAYGVSTRPTPTIC